MCKIWIFCSRLLPLDISKYVPRTVNNVLKISSRLRGEKTGCLRRPPRPRPGLIARLKTSSRFENLQDSLVYRFRNIIFLIPHDIIIILFKGLLLFFFFVLFQIKIVQTNMCACPSSFDIISLFASLAFECLNNSHQHDFILSINYF